MKRFETFTGKQARLSESGEIFEDVAVIRAETGLFAGGRDRFRPVADSLGKGVSNPVDGDVRH